MNTIHKLTLRSLLMNKSRTAMTIVAIILSCALITVVAGMSTSAWQSFINSTINSYGDYDVYFEGKFTDKNVNELKINRDVEGIYYERYVGVAEIPEPVSSFKPYFVEYTSKASINCGLWELMNNFTFKSLTNNTNILANLTCHSGWR